MYATPYRASRWTAGLIPHRPSRHAVISSLNGNATKTVTQLLSYIATPMP